MSERVKDILSFALGLVVTVATLFLVISWDFQPADIAVAIVFALGVAVGIWATRVWYGIGRDSWHITSNDRVRITKPSRSPEAASIT